jgi:hypothetical protein
LEQRKKLTEAEDAMRHRPEEEYKRTAQAQINATVKLDKEESNQQLLSEREQSAKNLKEAEARELALKNQAERDKQAAAKLAKQQAEEQIAQLAAERDQGTKN